MYQGIIAGEVAMDNLFGDEHRSLRRLVDVGTRSTEFAEVKKCMLSRY